MPNDLMKSIEGAQDRISKLLNKQTGGYATGDLSSALITGKPIAQIAQQRRAGEIQNQRALLQSMIQTGQLKQSGERLELDREKFELEQLKQNATKYTGFRGVLDVLEKDVAPEKHSEALQGLKNHPGITNDTPKPVAEMLAREWLGGKGYLTGKKGKEAANPVKREMPDGSSQFGHWVGPQKNVWRAVPGTAIPRKAEKPSETERLIEQESLLLLEQQKGPLPLMKANKLKRIQEKLSPAPPKDKGTKIRTYFFPGEGIHLPIDENNPEDVRLVMETRKIPGKAAYPIRIGTETGRTGTLETDLTKTQAGNVELRIRAAEKDWIENSNALRMLETPAAEWGLGLKRYATEMFGTTAAEFGISNKAGIFMGPTLEQTQEIITKMQTIIGRNVATVTGDDSGRYSDKDIERVNRAIPATQSITTVPQARAALKVLNEANERAIIYDKIKQSGKDYKSNEGVAMWAYMLGQYYPKLNKQELVKRALEDIDGYSR